MVSQFKLASLNISAQDILSLTGLFAHVMHVDGTILDANKAFLFGLSLDEQSIHSVNFYDHLVDEASQATIQMIRNQVDQGMPVRNRTITLRPPSGQVVIVESNWQPLVIEHTPLLAVFMRDVTLERQHETDLERLFDQASDLMGIADFEGRFVKLNPAWELKLGFAIDEMIGERFMDFVHPDDLDKTLREANRSTHGESIGHGFLNRYRTREGAYRWLLWNYKSYPDHQRTYFVAQDITDSREADERLKQATNQLQAILDNSGTVISMKDVRGYYILVNLEFAERFGTGDKTWFAGQTDEDLFPASLALRLRQNDQQVLDQGRAMQFEETLPGEDGLHTYLSTKFLLKDANQQPYAICTIATDITYRKLTEMQLTLRNQAIEFSPTSISIADATLPDIPLIYVNPAFEEMTGYSQLDAIGRNCRFLQADDHDQPAIRTIRNAIQAGEGTTVILRNYRKTGELFYNELRLAPIYDNQNTLTHYVGLSMDVTERETAQAKIQEQNQALIAANRALAVARREAEEATRLKSQFLATMSHELRTPLNAIIGYTEIQLAGMTGQLNEEQRDYQERVLANAEHLLSLINDVLDIAKIEAGRMELLNKPFHIQQWIDGIDAQMRVLTDEKNLKLVIEVDRRMPEQIVADSARIRQVVINLLSNAIKFTNEGVVRLQVRKHGRDAWKIIVGDTGIGIPPHMQETIFEEFRQVDSSSMRKHRGTGLGLAIVRKFILMMGGNIRVKSELGKGSEFTVILPLNEPVVSQRTSNTIGEDHD